MTAPLGCVIVRVLVAIPALNEATVIADVLASLSAVQPLRDVVVIDDGSRDDTASIARAAGAHVLSHAINLGVGAAMGTAFKYAVQNGYDAVIQFDGDGQHRAEHSRRPHRGRGTFRHRHRKSLCEWRVVQIVGSATRRSTVHRVGHVSVCSHAAHRRDERIPYRGPERPRRSSPSTTRSSGSATPWSRSCSRPARDSASPRSLSSMNERAGGVPSQSVFRATLYTGRILFILVTRRPSAAVPPQIKALKLREQKAARRDPSTPRDRDGGRRCSSP